MQTKQNMSYEQQHRFAEAASNELEGQAEDLIIIDYDDDDDAKVFIAKQGIHRPPNDDVHQKLKRKKSCLAASSRKKQKSNAPAKKPAATTSRHETHPVKKKTVATKKSTAGVSAKKRGFVVGTIKIIPNTGTARFTNEWHNDLPFVVSLYKGNQRTTNCRKCKSCSVDFARNPPVPHNMVIQHHERYRYPQAGVWKFTESKTRAETYHCSASCITKRHDYFDVSRLRLKNGTRQDMQAEHKDLLREEFGVNLSDVEDES